MASLLVCLVIPITTLYVVQLLKKCKYQLNSTMIILIVIQNIISQNPTLSLSFSPTQFPSQPTTRFQSMSPIISPSSSPTQFPLQPTTTTHVPVSTQF
eukprot:17900_1